MRLKADFLRLILRAGVDPARRSLLVDFVETYMPLQTEEETQFVQLVREGKTYAEVKQMVTTYEKAGRKQGRAEGIEKGRAEGIEKGLEKGLEKGKLESLLLVMEKRFPKMSDDVRRKVERMTSTKRIDELLVAALSAKSLSDLPL